MKEVYGEKMMGGGDRHREDEETPLLLSKLTRSRNSDTLDSKFIDDGADTSSPQETGDPIFVNQRRQRLATTRRRGVILSLLVVALMVVVILFDGVGHDSISWRRNQKHHKKHSKKGSLMESTGMMFEQLVRRARKSFSKVVIVLINDQGDDTGDDDHDDQDSDSKDAQEEEKQEEDRNNNNHGIIKKKKTENKDDSDDDYIDDDSVKEEARTAHQNENGTNDGDSGDGSDSECAQKDWKCWRDKYTNEKTETTNAKNDASDVQDMKSDDDQGGEKKAIEGSIELEGKARTTSSEGADAPSSSSRHSSSQGERGVSSKSEKNHSRKSKAKKSPNGQERERKSTKSNKEEAKALKKWDETKSEGADYCEDGKYSKRTLKLAYEMPFQGLFRDTKGQRKFEASSVIVVDSMAYAICDSSWSISMFDPYLHPFGEHNHQIGDPDREVEDSGYEALFYDNSTFFVVRESVEARDDTYHAVIEELLLDPEVNHDSYEFGRACPTEFAFEGDSKGFEGAIPIHDLNGDLIVLGLCEGNHCSQSKELQRDKGNGRLVAMKLVTLPDGSCEWSTIRVINVPKTAYFGDYSSIAMDLSGRVMISSQEESQLWIGQLDGIQPSGLWNVTGIEFRKDERTIFDFPKNDNCETTYCNIEGVHWVDEYTIIAVSDKMKSKGKQPYSCFEKDQSAHLFVLP